MSCHLLFDHFQFTLIHGPNIPGSYAILFLQHRTLLSWPDTSAVECCFHFGSASLFFLKLLAIALSSSSVAYGTPSDLWGFIFWCHIFLPFHTVHEFLQARILEWVAIYSSSGPRFVRTLQYDPSTLSDLVWHGSALLSYTNTFNKAVIPERNHSMSFDNAHTRITHILIKI